MEKFLEALLGKIMFLKEHPGKNSWSRHCSLSSSSMKFAISLAFLTKPYDLLAMVQALLLATVLKKDKAKRKENSTVKGPRVELDLPSYQPTQQYRTKRYKLYACGNSSAMAMV